MGGNRFVQWLNLNASVVHALTLSAGAIIVGLLAAITWKYRKPSSKRPAPLNPASALDAEAAIRRELQAQVALLSSVVNALPVADSSRITEAMLNGDDLRDFPFARFRTLASEIDAATDSAAALVETNLRWLSELIREIRSVRSGTHYDWNKFPRVQYNEVIRVTRRPLKVITLNLDLREHEQGSALPRRG